MKAHFKGFFNETDCSRPVPEGLSFKTLNVSDKLWLERMFIEVDIRDAIWSCDGSKSASLDGYSTKFFMGDFHGYALLTKVCTSCS